MNPFEVERLGWEEIRGLPIVADPEIGTGRFRIVCSRDLDGGGLEEVEAVGNAGRGRRSRSRAATELRPVPEVDAEVAGQLLGLDVELGQLAGQIRMPIAIRITPPMATIAW